MKVQNCGELATPICRIAFVFVLLSLVGCSTSGNSFFGVSKRLETADRITLTGANPLLDSENFEEVDLEMLLDPKRLRKTVYSPYIGFCGKYKKEAPPKDNANDQNDANNLDNDEEYNERTACINRAYLAAATTAFYDPKYDTSIELRRNRVQDRLLASSEQRCGAYKQYLKAYDIHWETSLGIGTTVMAAAGAIATGTLNTRAFSGLAAMLSGSRSEIRQGVFSNLASFVIIPGIENKRSIALVAIKANRKLDIADYTVEAAMHDAFTYHNACTLESGLEAAQESIKRIDNPGIVQINKTLAQLSETKQLAKMVDLATKGELTADNSKVVAVQYVPVEVELAGGGRMSATPVDKTPQQNAKTLLAYYDAMTKSVVELQLALSAKANHDDTKPLTKTNLLNVVEKLKKYSKEAVKGVAPANTFVSTRTHLRNASNEIEKAILEYDQTIVGHEIELYSVDKKQKDDLQVVIATNKAMRSTYTKLAFDDIVNKTNASVTEIAKFVEQKHHVVDDLAKLDAQLKKLSEILALKKPAMAAKSVGTQ